MYLAIRIPHLPNTKQADEMVEQMAMPPCPPKPSFMGKRFALYGNGNLGHLAKEYLKLVGCEPVLVFEQGRDVDNSLAVAVCIVTSPFTPIAHSLKQRGFQSVVPFYDLTEMFRDVHPLANGWFAEPFNLIDKQQINTVMRMWGDAVSRAHHLQFLAWRRLREEWIFEEAPLPDCPRFFIPEVTSVLHDHETFIDAGAHHGSVSRVFIEQVKGQFERIIAIEPDNINRAVYCESLYPNEKVGIVSCALAEHEGIANFHSKLDYASQLSPTGHEYVITYPLDALKLKPTFIKYHLEGGELAALKGSLKTLEECRPIVAVAVYHNEDGLWETPVWLMTYLSNYKFLFRLHSWCGTGAVVYAIPNERVRAS